MASKNRISLVGNLGRDPEIKDLPDGRKVCNFSVATNERFLNKTTNEWENAPTDWHKITVWGKRAETAKARLAKGNLVGIEGRLCVRSYMKGDVEIPDVYVVADEILYLDRYEKREAAAPAAAGQGPGAEDDLPF